MAKKRLKYNDFCQSCRKPLGADDKIFYVEQSSNRFFCSEKCIRNYYDPMSDFYRQQMLKIRDPHDVPEGDFGEYESYAPLCLAHPDEVWEDQTENGEKISVYMAGFTNEGGKFTYIVQCFCLEAEPTYVLLSFPTRDRRLVEEFRRGTRMAKEDVEEAAEPEINSHLQDDFLARQGGAVEEEMLKFRQPQDIPPTEFEEFTHHLDPTIEEPDEVWELQDEGENTLLTLISQPEESLHYVVICVSDQKTEEQESWRVIYQFPTRDLSLVQRYRRGQLREGVEAKASFLH
jgi:hypothetical protein